MKTSFIKTLRAKVIIAVAATITLVASSCEKILDVKPNDVLRDEDFMKSYWDADFISRGTYQALQGLIGPIFCVGEFQGDWVVPGPGATADEKELAEHRVTPKNKFTDWTPYYDLINRANYAVKNLPRVPPNANYFNDKQLKQSIGEAKFLRALAYYYLVRTFGDVPLTMESTDDISKVKYLPATSQEIVLDSVEADLKEAYTYTDREISVPNTFDLGLRVSVETTRLRATKGTVAGFQAEVYLYRNKYQDALTACQNFANTGTYNGAGNNNASWVTIFTNYPRDVYGEPMLAVFFSFQSREINPLMFIESNDPKSGGRYEVAPSEVAIKTYHPNYPSISTDVVKDDVYRGFGFSFAGSAPFYNRLGSAPVIWKHIGLARITPANIDVPPNVRAPYESDAAFHIIRQADVYLLWAEAYNRAGDKANAIAQLNRVRGRVGVPNVDAANNPLRITTASTTEQIEDIILRERGLELGFEGRRWFDLLRIARHRGNTAGAELIISMLKKRAPVAEHAYLEARMKDPKYWYLPYNEREVALNPNLKQKDY